METAGKWFKVPSGYTAFVPNPLPPKFVWTDAIVASVSSADHVLGMLAREAMSIPNPHLLIRPFITREAVLSSQIEGTQATVGQVLANEAGMQISRNEEDLQEVHNYIMALDFGLKRIQEFPLSIRVIRELHEVLMQGVRGAHATPGEFRRTQNWIGPAGCTLATAKFVPPPPEEMMECLSQLEKFLHDQRLPPLIHVALCHYQFEAIHPFLDGNGRIGRLLIILLLIQRQILPSPILYLSSFFEATRDEYYRQLLNVSREGTWEEWLIYFLQGVTLQAKDVLSRAERINKLLMEWQEMTGGRSEGLMKKVITQLAVNPFFTANKIASTFDVAFTTAQRAIEKLEAAHIVTQVSEGKRDRIYCAKQILEILEEPTKIVKFL